MATRILVVGRPTRPSSPAEMDAVAKNVQRDFTVCRCHSPGELIRVVDEARGGERVEILDIYDHATIGEQRLGSGVLFASDGDRLHDIVGLDVATELHSRLAETAHVRLLGCGTASNRNAAPSALLRGRLLLAKLGRALGGRRVAFGTTADVDSSHFDPDGFRSALEMTFLSSSLAALDAVAPDATRRAQNTREVFRHADDG